MQVCKISVKYVKQYVKYTNKFQVSYFMLKLFNFNENNTINNNIKMFWLTVKFYREKWVNQLKFQFKYLVLI